MEYVINTDKPLRHMHLPNSPYLSIRDQDDDEYPWSGKVIIIDGQQTSFFYADGEFFVDFVDGDSQKDQVEWIEEQVKDMSEEDQKDFRQANIKDFRDRIEYIITYSNGNGEIVDLVELVEEVLS